MKKLIFLSILAAGIVSCGKTTRGKIAGEWKVDTMETKNSSGGNSETETFTGASYSITQLNGSLSVTVSGTVATNDITFDKDGTFSWSRNYTVTVGSTTTTTDEKFSGNWSLAKKTGDYKKSERLILDITSYTSTETENSSTSTYTMTSPNGENPIAFKVIESKGKALSLALDNSSSSSSTSPFGSFSSSGTSSMTLELSAK